MSSADKDLLHNPKILCVLASLMLATFFITAVDSDGVERDPYHSHTVVGGTLVEQARTLADHLRHGHVWDWARVTDGTISPAPPGDGRVCTERNNDAGRGARVLSFRAGGAGVSIVGIDGGIIRAALWRLHADERPVAHVADPFGGALLDIVLPVPTPPPKLA